MIRTCLFDLGNVLVHFSHDQMCAQMGAVCGITGADVRRLLFDSGLQWEFECGRLSERELHCRFEESVDRSLDFEELRRAGADIFRLNEPMVPVLDELKSCGVRLVLLSNTSVTHFEWVRKRFDLLDRFDEYVVSFRVGAIKPDEAIYRAALAAIQCTPGECFYTDDIADYVRSGRELGLQAEVFTDAAALRRQLAALGALDNNEVI